MTKTARGTFEIKDWDEKKYQQLDGGGKLTEAKVTQTFTGDIEGEGSVIWLMAYPDAKTASFVGIQRIVGSIAGKKGSFVVQTIGEFDGTIAKDGLTFFGVDDLGLDKQTRAIILSLCTRFGGGPVGLSTLAISVSEPTETVEDVYEPYLIQQGLLMRTPRGRVATLTAWQHLGLLPPTSLADSTGIPGLFD